MNLIEACKEMEKGKKVTHKSWEKNTYIYKNGIYLNFCDCTQMSKVRKEYYINDINLILSSDWEIYKSPEEILNKKGKLFDISKYCRNSICSKCVLHNENMCTRENKPKIYRDLLIDRFFFVDTWSDEEIDEMYKLIKDKVE